MQPETFVGPNLARLLVAVRLAYGEDAVVIRTRGPAETDGRNYEVVAAAAGSEPAAPVSPRPLDAEGPPIIAFVGPPGSGKTTTIVKVALNDGVFGDRRVGVLSLDTYRAAALEQLNVYSEIAGFPLEIAYDAAGVEGALARLADCDIILVDTPGRALRGAARLEWRSLLKAAAADEVHLVIDAGLRVDVALAIADAHRWCGTTHVLFTKLDALPAGTDAREMKDRLNLPVRWMSDGPDVPHDLRIASIGGAGHTHRRMVS